MLGPQRVRALRVALGLALGATTGSVHAGAQTEGSKPAPPTASGSSQSKSKSKGKSSGKTKNSGKSQPKSAKRDGGSSGPGAGAGERSVPSARLPPSEASKSSDAATKGSSPKTKADAKAKPKAEPKNKATAKKKPSAAAGDHRQGRRPRLPEATLPDGVEPAPPRRGVRKAVAGGAPKDQQRLGKDDPQLRALREADRVLFPRPLSGVTPGWSWTPPVASGPVVWADGLPPAHARPRPDLRGLDAKDATWLRGLTLPDLPVRFDERVVRYLKFYRDNPRGQAISRAWARKAGRLGPTIRAKLARAGAPTGLIWLSMVESGHNAAIVSHAGAVGLWQFMPGSGRDYGLTVDRWVDERMDPARSTDAAIKYLSDLRQRFGNWELAMAAYNMGQGGLARAIRKFNTNDFWELSRYEAGIPWETSLYVPKVMALAIVMANPATFGIDKIEPDAPERFDVVRVPAGTSMQRIARASESDGKSVAGLNRHILSERIPPTAAKATSRTWDVRVPSGKGAVAAKKLARVGSGVSSKLEPYTVRFGDTIDAIAAERGVRGSRIRSLNHIRIRETLTQGTVLLVPRADKDAVAASGDDQSVVVVPPRPFHYPDRRRVFFEVRRGDAVGTIAHAFAVQRDELSAWNGLDDSARLVAGMVLQVYVPKDAALVEVRHRTETDVRILVAGSKPFFDHFEAEAGRKRITVKARKGDTLAKVAKRYRLSLGWVERINRGSRHKKLAKGDEVVVYVAADAAAKHVAGASSIKALPDVKAPKPDALPGSKKAPPQKDVKPAKKPASKPSSSKAPASKGPAPKKKPAKPASTKKKSSDSKPASTKKKSSDSKPASTKKKSSDSKPASTKKKSSDSKPSTKKP
jgi:membrane-bound lytic murein transglycosylase D